MHLEVGMVPNRREPMRVIWENPPMNRIVHLGPHTLGIVFALSLGFAGCNLMAQSGDDGQNARMGATTKSGTTTGSKGTSGTTTTATGTTGTKTGGTTGTKTGGTTGTETSTETSTTGETTDTGGTTSTKGTKTKSDPCPVDPKSAPMGAATDYNLFVFNDYTATSTDVGGTVAVGGDMTVSSFGTGSALPSGYKGVSLSVGDDLSYANGQVFQGDVEVGGTITNPGPGGFNVQHGTATDGVKGVFDAGSYETDMEDISAYLAGLDANGSWTEGYGQVTLTGTDKVLNVIDLDLDAIKNQWATDARYTHWAPTAVNALTIDAPSGSTVVINVSGDTSVFLQAHGIFLVGVSGDAIVYNFHDAKASSHTIAASPVYGTVLAPHAAIAFDNTQMHGQLIADSVSGTGELHELSFSGDICVESDKTTDTGTKSTKTTKTDTGTTTWKDKTKKKTDTGATKTDTGKKYYKY